jgi:hypothetical protein
MSNKTHRKSDGIAFQNNFNKNKKTKTSIDNRKLTFFVWLEGRTGGTTALCNNSDANAEITLKVSDGRPLEIRMKFDNAEGV